MLKLILLLSLLVCFSCNKNDTTADLPIPQDVGSLSDKNYLSGVINEIQRYAAQLGIEQNFTNFPVLVVHDGPVGDGILAYCQRDDGGKGVFIGVLDTTMAKVTRNFDSAAESFIYMILVHEFGHCLYGRGHDNSEIRVPGYDIYFNVRGQEFLVGESIKVSAMSVNRGLDMPIPVGVKKYYLQEVAGLRRWQSIRDLESNSGIELIPFEVVGSNGDGGNGDGGGGDSSGDGGSGDSGGDGSGDGIPIVPGLPDPVSVPQ
jgi:hypothetical protein